MNYNWTEVFCVFALKVIAVILGLAFTLFGYFIFFQKKYSLINGFEEETAPLNEKEQKMIPDVITMLTAAKGSNKAVKNATISRMLLSLHGEDVSGSRIRKIINYIRNEDLVSCLVASSKGYYIADNEQELLDYEESLEKRVQAICKVLKHIIRQRKDRFQNQQQGALFL